MQHFIFVVSKWNDLQRSVHATLCARSGLHFSKALFKKGFYCPWARGHCSVVFSSVLVDIFTAFTPRSEKRPILPSCYPDVCRTLKGAEVSFRHHHLKLNCLFAVTRSLLKRNPPVSDKKWSLCWVGFVRFSVFLWAFDDLLVFLFFCVCLQTGRNGEPELFVLHWQPFSWWKPVSMQPPPRLHPLCLFMRSGSHMHVWLLGTIE